MPDRLWIRKSIGSYLRGSKVHYFWVFLPDPVGVLHVGGPSVFANGEDEPHPRHVVFEGRAELKQPPT